MAPTQQEDRRPDDDDLDLIRLEGEGGHMAPPQNSDRETDEATFWLFIYYVYWRGDDEG